MNLNDALALVSRIENLPQIYDQMERAVYGVMHSYFSELYEIEKKEAEVYAQVEREKRGEKLSPLLVLKNEVHTKYWLNEANFYKPCSSSSHPDHVWGKLTDIEVMQNGDAQNLIFIFKARKNGRTITAYQLKRVENTLKIEHTFFG